MHTSNVAEESLSPTGTAVVPVSSHHVDLFSGTLHIQVHKTQVPLEQLCGFASRYNAARGFLIVSKVLGKHYPVRPSTMGKTYSRLGEMIGMLPLAAPFCCIGMAETAIGFGRGVFEVCQSQPAWEQSLYIHTTRYRLSHPSAMNIDEAHCHAREHAIYVPDTQEKREIFFTAKTLVLLDDEMSTGNTLLNLANAYVAINPALERVVLVTLTCWLDAAQQEKLARLFPVPVSFVALLEGLLQFDVRKNPAAMPRFHSVGDWAPKDALLRNNYGRVGSLPKENIPDMDPIIHSLQLDVARPVLVLGTGEFAYQPFMLALALEQQGYTVFYQSTTRTPIAVGQDVQHAIRFSDNYHENIDNFLYNVDVHSGFQHVLCYETATLPQEHTLPEILNAKVVFF